VTGGEARGRLKGFLAWSPGGAEGGQRQNARAATAEAARCAAAPAAWRSSPLSAALVLGEPLELVEIVPRFNVLKCLKVRRHDRRPGNSDICVPIGRAVASANCEARTQEVASLPRTRVVSSIKISARVARAIVCRSTVRHSGGGAHSATKKASITGVQSRLRVFARIGSERVCLPYWLPPRKRTERATLPREGPPRVGVPNCTGLVP